eukprot:TRINITY_DN9689_c0_g1_i1.p1 TRINITY_DN9689_c0_g1~~TRINITY_DN9689_c0_g1_i1.p1  ORF type:complete len:382 (+),score=129.78 TRINITY_DN9689_c0_g1_i1:58-1146(+)
MGCGGSKEKKTQSSSGSSPGNAAVDDPMPARQMSDNPLARKKIDGALMNDINEDYEIGDELGRGGFSVVVEATRKEDGEKYAIKIVEKNVIKEDIKLLKREIDIMKKVDHENILKLFEIYEDDVNVYIVMELINGSELFDRIVDKGYYSEANTTHLVKQILSAVQYLHDIGIAHRDLKPENLLCSGTGDEESVKIADFGLSKMFDGNEMLMTSCGTPGYVAPEVLMCESYDKSVDMWGIGIITYILLAGYPPFYAENDTALFEKIMGAEYDFDDECWDDVSDLAKDFIQHLLVKDPNKRFTAEQALEHEWLQGGASDKKLKIKAKMEDYNIQRKDEKDKRDAAFRDDLEDSVGELNNLAAKK